MRNLNPLNIWRSFLALPNTTPLKTLGVAFLVALVCSVIVSLAAVTLKPLHDKNRLQARVSAMIEMLDGIGAGFPQQRWVNRTTGEYANRKTQDQTLLKPELDLAGLQQVEGVFEVYELRQDGRLQLVVLPIRGVGYKSMMKGYLALKSDLKTIAALTFHQQDESPGMGARIMEKEWQDLWKGKNTIDENGVIRIKIVKGKSEGVYQVDGITGATRTGWGINDLLQFWLGPDGYGPYLERLKLEAGS
ncbi:MAG: NADH:ubiquinone reductase (Na(+)-transporting) subunit C [Rhodospirillaceae bacterium]|nr:MAG: NADH:ubiquinone reductase (Na(+)-transporting) subunit C [Rhodospirillaceae bacterium]